MFTLKCTRRSALLVPQVLGPWLKDELSTFENENIFYCRDLYHTLQWIDASEFQRNAMKNMHNSSSQHLVPDWNSNPGVTAGPCTDSQCESPLQEPNNREVNAPRQSSHNEGEELGWGPTAGPTKAPWRGCRGSGCERDLRSEWGSQQKLYSLLGAFISLVWLK